MRVEGGRALRSDGPFPEAGEALGRYLLFEAEALDAAIEVRPIIER